MAMKNGKMALSLVAVFSGKDPSASCVIHAKSSKEAMIELHPMAEHDAPGSMSVKNVAALMVIVAG